MSRIESAIRRVTGAVTRNQTELSPSLEDIEMAGEIQTILRRFYIVYVKDGKGAKGISHFSLSPYENLPNHLAINFGVHRIGREEVRREHLPGRHPAYFYDIQDLSDSNMRWGIKIEPMRVRFFQVVRDGEYERFNYSPEITTQKMEEIRQSFQQMPKKPFDHAYAFKAIRVNAGQ